MEALKEYAGVVTALVTVMAALGALGLWAINAQVTPEINRLEGRIDGNQLLLRQIDRKIDANFEGLNARFKGIDAKFAVIDAKFEAIDDRFQAIDARFERIDGELKIIRNDIKTILLRLPNKTAAP